MIDTELNALLDKAKKDPNLKEQLLSTKNSTEPVQEFCELCQSLGYNITVGELMTIGSDMSDSKLRSVNGGGAFEIEGWDDAYDNFFVQLEWSK